jgi:hypothetical protein
MSLRRKRRSTGALQNLAEIGGRASNVATAAWSAALLRRLERSCKVSSILIQS